MATIHKLTKDGSTIFPATITDAIVHPNTGKTLTSMIKDYNVSELFPSEGLDGGNKYNLALAIQVLGSHLTAAEKTGGIKITFISSVSPYPEEEYYLNKNTWSTTLSDWGQRFEVGDVIADPSGSWEQGTAEQYIDQQTAILTTNLASETIARQTVDSNLQTQINTEVSTRTASDNTQNGRIGVLEEAYRNLTESDVIVGPRPSSGQQANVIYREPDQDHTPPQFYCDYMWYDNAWVLMAQYDNGIDNNPLPNSNNLVKSSGVFNSMGAFDISAYNSNHIYQNLTEALNAVPSAMRAGGMSVKFIQEITPAKYSLVKTEGLTTEPTGTELSSDPNLVSGTYTAAQLNNLSTVSALPTTLNSSKTYYLEIAGDSTTYTTWVVTYVSTSDNKYVQFRYMSTSTANADFTNVGNWQGIDEKPVFGSKNLIYSNGVAQSLNNVEIDINKKVIFDDFDSSISGWQLSETIIHVIQGKTYRLSVLGNIQATEIQICYVNSGTVISAITNSLSFDKEIVAAASEISIRVKDYQSGSASIDIIDTTSYVNNIDSLLFLQGVEKTYNDFQTGDWSTSAKEFKLRKGSYTFAMSGDIAIGSSGSIQCFYMDGSTIVAIWTSSNTTAKSFDVTIPKDCIVQVRIKGYQSGTLNMSVKIVDEDHYDNAYALCQTAEDVAEKVISVDSTFKLQKGSRMVVYMQNTSTVFPVTLKVGNFSAYEIYFNSNHCLAGNIWDAGCYLDIFFNGNRFYANVINIPTFSLDTERNGYYTDTGLWVDNASWKTSYRIFVQNGVEYYTQASYVAMFDKDSNFLGRFASISSTNHTFASDVSYIRLCSDSSHSLDIIVSEKKKVFPLIKNLSDISELVIGKDYQKQYVTGKGQIKELYLASSGNYVISWVRRNYPDWGWGIAIAGGTNEAYSEQYDYEPNGVIPLYAETFGMIPRTVVGYCVIDWSKQTSGTSDGTSSTINSICYTLSNCPIIQSYLGQYNRDACIIPYLKEQSGDIAIIRNKVNKELNYIKKYGARAISWVDDDFMINDETFAPRYNAMRAWCNQNGIYPSMALIPSDVTTPDADTQTQLATKIDAVRSWAEDGFHFLYHPVHYGWYGENRSLAKVRKQVLDCLRVFNENSVPSKYKILVYPGSSSDIDGVEDIAKEYFDIAINIRNDYNIGNGDKFQLNRIFPEYYFASGYSNAKTQAKQRIAGCIAHYGWCIIGSHIWKWTVSDTVDETTLSTANLFEIISYANNLVPIKPVEVIWDEQKMMYELNK